MKYPWKIYASGRYVDSGTIEAESEKIAMGLVLIEQADKDRDPDTCYSVTVGERVTTSFGDEFLESAGAGSIDGPDHLASCDKTLETCRPHVPWDRADATPMADIREAIKAMANAPILDPIPIFRPTHRKITTDLKTEVLLTCQGCDNEAYVSIPGIPAGAQIHQVSGVTCGKCGQSHTVDIGS